MHVATLKVKKKHVCPECLKRQVTADNWGCKSRKSKYTCNFCGTLFLNKGKGLKKDFVKFEEEVEVSDVVYEGVTIVGDA